MPSARWPSREASLYSCSSATQITTSPPGSVSGPEIVLCLPRHLPRRPSRRTCWHATATDENPTNPDVTCSKNSGDTFPIGNTTVTCSASDAAGNEAEGSFNVTVQDTTPPEITGTPSDIAKTATSSSGVPVSYAPPTANDLVDGSVAVNCAPASGSTFALDSTTVDCSANDSRNNTASQSFTVNVTYSWGGVLRPVNGGTTLNDYADDNSSFRLSSTVPVKFNLSGDSARITDATAKLFVAKVNDNVVGDEVEAGSTAAASTGNLFRYDATNDQYVFNWSTKGLEAGIYQLRIDLGDGTTNTVWVSLR